MYGKSAQTPVARLFVALDLPEAVRARLAAWGAQAAQRAGGALRAVPPANLHLTLAFLGSREETQAEAIGAVITATTEATPHLKLGTALWLPPRRPNVLTVQVTDDSGALTAIHSSLVAALSVRAASTPEAHPLRPHITVGRVRRNQRVRIDLPTPPSATFTATALTLYRSITSQEGARYEPLARRTLA